MSDDGQCYETVDAATREAMLDEYGYECEVCSRCSPEAGGLATLEVHHQTRDPDDVDVHDPANLTVLCRGCHSWYHEKTSPEDVPVEITAADKTKLLPKDIEILEILAVSGPATTGAVAAQHSADPDVNTVRERLRVLMGLDNWIESRDRQIVDQDAETGAWGLAEQISESKRGRIPPDPQTLVKRVQAANVRRALDAGCDRETIAAVFDVSYRTTFYREHRARAYGFPLDAIEQRNGGRPTADDAVDDQVDATAESDRRETGDQQQRLDAVRDAAGDRSTGTDATGDTAAFETDTQGESRSDQSGADRSGNPREHVQKAIEALQALNRAL